MERTSVVTLHQGEPVSNLRNQHTSGEVTRFDLTLPLVRATIPHTHIMSSSACPFVTRANITLVPSRHMLRFPDTSPLSRLTLDGMHLVTTTGFGTGVGLILEYSRIISCEWWRELGAESGRRVKCLPGGTWGSSRRFGRRVMI